MRVVAAVLDPNPQVAGRGLRMLRDAGIKAECGLLEAEARAENAGFLTRMTRGTPWVRMKAAATLDGRTAFLDGRSQWITGPAAREDGHRYRSWSGAVLTGIGTVLADDPQMNVRLPDRPVETTRQPLRVVVDGRMKTPPSAKILHTPGGAVWIVTARTTRASARRSKPPAPKSSSSPTRTIPNTSTSRRSCACWAGRK